MNELLELMQKAKENKERKTDIHYNNIKEKSEQGNEEAQEIMRFGNEKEIKTMISKNF